MFVLADWEIDAYSRYSQVQANPEYERVFSGPLFALLGSGWSFIDHHHDALIALFTIVLAFVTTALAKYTYGLWEETKTLREGADRQAAESKTQNSRQLSIAGRQLRLLTEQGNIQRSQFFATHRPKLIVRRVLFELVNERGGEESHILVQYVIANVGNSAAKIVELSQRVFLNRGANGEEIPRMPNYAPPIDPGIEIARGESVYREYRELDQATVNIYSFQEGSTQTRRLNPEGAAAYFAGYIRYVDGMQNDGRTAFLRQHDFISGRSTPVDDPDFEYQD